MKSNRAFTFVEIMIVVVIIGLIAAMAIPAIQKVKASSIKKRIDAGMIVTREERQYVKDHYSRSADEKRKEESASSEVRAEETHSLLDGKRVLTNFQILELDGQKYVLVPKIDAKETEIAGKVYWLVPASR